MKLSQLLVKPTLLPLSLLLGSLITISTASADSKYVAQPGHPSLQEWLLPDEPPYPADNKPSPARIALGKQLYFDPRIGRDGNMSCATCHSPMLGWSDGLPTAKGFKSQVLGRASPVITNTAFNSLQMWDGRKKSLEDQATGPMEATVEMNTDMIALKRLLNNNGYREAFAEAYPGEPVDATTAGKAIAAFERTIISNNSAFDRWVKGDTNAMSVQQVQGFKLFIDPDKGNCEVCHSAPNFTDNGFHNVGLASYGKENPDMGRYAQKPIRILKGAFKTPTLRDIELSAPYFHDGSSSTLMEAVQHYNRGGEVKQDLSPNIKALKLNQQEMEAIVAFLKALTTPQKPFKLPLLPLE
ncbi:cytochrome-c peroxidase [Candidatus Endoriftia persephonae]|jgi:cytochrome c peroxidase|uniref:Methylamine utilization protein MauG n=2 Tax=Gammaproteobacteria TaxID=1236 RepID=G2FFU3_9GAMM|nr:cytochrome c peroxidase [Candidatus Endoriftia persephone]EGW54345.1 methylamine utilization protein MauG [endosymbiont of Tevnia jerichonana (vent Tica)]USF87044.1 c-type cytochrome [Candidatus Endoriftia persephone]